MSISAKIQPHLLVLVDLELMGGPATSSSSPMATFQSDGTITQHMYTDQNMPWGNAGAHGAGWECLDRCRTEKKLLSAKMAIYSCVAEVS